MIADNLASIMDRANNAAIRAGRDPGEVRLVAAAKTQSVEKIREAVDAGVRILGHNYVQEAERQPVMDDVPGLKTHMIGHLQRNKARKAVEIFDTVQTVDNSALAIELDRRAHVVARRLDVLIQVNLSGEPQKSGIGPDEVEDLASAIRELSSISLKGLMTMPPFFDDPENARPYFAELRKLRDRLIASGAFTKEMTELSMGMTGDFEAAVEEGATLIRIGTALFGPRA